MKKAFVKNPYLPPPFGQNKTLNRRPKQHCNQQYDSGLFWEEAGRSGEEV
jgi:hypothetical protein